MTRLDSAWQHAFAAIDEAVRSFGRGEPDAWHKRQLARRAMDEWVDAAVAAELARLAPPKGGAR